ncbi:hypothetical protein SAMN02745220_01215 [Desulfopila aestuarii DSM 18488]|uniref:Uncharacterized protein n=1 Tax=Desulfopila aestuarii DSM 18488 TaxID=1121416 RepID=A0A1M7Y238_9BACT|nr:hypothetical protein SAMN02745220_01215 [Desulfopila aestuarii DSM 18488]
MHDDGLFIPLEDYVETYCSSREYTGCCHLAESSTTDQNASMAEKIRILHDTIVGCKH